jgi:hypothetical protein
MIEHVGDDAALYALGILDETERARIDLHASACTACALLLAQASDDVATLAAAGASGAVATAPVSIARPIPSARRPSYRPFLAVAAALLIGLLPSLYFWQQDRSMHTSMVAQLDAMHRVAAMPHRTAAFSGAMGNGAQVIYAPDGSWYVVLVRGVPTALRVVWMHDGERTDLGTAVPHGDVAMLYLPASHRMDHLALMDGSTIVAEAQLVY